MAENSYFLWPPCLMFLIICVLVSLPTSHSQESPAYLGFVSNATEFPAEDYYDYIIVGGGTAGCPLAATLSEKFRVLVLERGGIPYGKPNLMTQDGFLTTLIEADAHESPAQLFTSEDGVPNARGRVLGGSSAINAGFYSRADQDFYTRSGINWDLRVVNQSYDWVEKAIVFRPELKNWQSAVRDGLLEAGIDPYNGFSLDHVRGTKIGGSTFDSSGRRHSAADLLSYANPSNIKVVVHASVERVLLASSSAYPDAKKSAIGPSAPVAEWHRAKALSCFLGIPVAHHSPYVGQFLYDNPRNGISIVPPVPLDHSLIQVVGITSSGTYLEAASNSVPFASPAWPIFIRSPGSAIYLNVATLMEKIVGPLSSGSLRLASTDVRANPIVRFNYFSNPGDLERCVNGTRKIADVLKTRAMKDFRFHHLFGARSSDMWALHCLLISLTMRRCASSADARITWYQSSGHSSDAGEVFRFEAN
ncbi:UNVERIFIED_CONTAM: (R)-mandelonitrile lyase-like [Sesamum radiatum]|uniref:(R)-mandelonitrile lyase-like n=1 Tax=Sesamum radiatum TaxID=300843 RepID=A0AAW2WKN7_SESRA